MHKFYEYKNCSTCKKAKEYLKKRKVDFSIVPIRENPPSLKELEKMLDFHNGNIKKLLNTSSKDYREKNLKEKISQFSTKEILHLLQENGNLIKRPFFLLDKGQDGLVGFKEAEWASKKL